jgi:hypothetical protein
VVSLFRYAVGDLVSCLAWVGLPFNVVATDDERGTIALRGLRARQPLARSTFSPTMFMLTHEHWDSIWQLPDRAGMRQLEVFERFLNRHVVGKLISGYHLPHGFLALDERVVESLQRSTMFRIQALDVERGQVRVSQSEKTAKWCTGSLRR